MQEMNEQFKDAPNKTKTYEIDGVKYTVHSHFVSKADAAKDVEWR